MLNTTFLNGDLIIGTLFDLHYELLFSHLKEGLTCLCVAQIGWKNKKQKTRSHSKFFSLFLFSAFYIITKVIEILVLAIVFGLEPFPSMDIFSSHSTGLGVK